ncbi:MAG: hypothetical protein GY724_15270 [Actinomycetia bacterium]|nr:hypothetical protein [Actinomycetes bacterium]MCP4222685.1 hypothetical protein [Actinomycetes bacterium]MCP5032044.1 hypothetical protein [Actinomycetes bacterium]
MDYEVRNQTRGGSRNFENLADALAAVCPPLITGQDEWELVFSRTSGTSGTIIAGGRGPIPDTQVEGLTVGEDDLSISADPMPTSHPHLG